jgi:hypothetical protein
MLKKPENVPSSFDRLRMRSSVFNELILDELVEFILVVSLSNHGPHRFAAGPLSGEAGTPGLYEAASRRSRLSCSCSAVPG